jgi:quinol monooxygenase YgiN
MIQVIATIELADGKRDAFVQVVRKLVPQVLAEEGCIEYGLAIDTPTNFKAQIPLRPNTATFIEKWADLPALEKHLTAPHMKSYREEVKGLVVGSKLQVLEPA